MVEAGIAAGGGEGGVEMIGPTLAPYVEDRLAVPGDLLLRGEAGGSAAVELPGRGHEDRGALWSAVTRGGLADGGIDEDAADRELLGDVAMEPLQMLPVIELAGQAEGDLPGELGIFTLLGRLDGIP